MPGRLDAADEKLRAHARAGRADERGHNADIVHGVDLDRNAPGLPFAVSASMSSSTRER